MKLAFFILISVAILEFCAGRAYDDKSNAIAEIDRNFNEVLVSEKQVKTAINTERAGANGSNGEKDTLVQLDAKVGAAKAQFEEDAKAVIRTAIVQSKPMTVIYCIRNVTFTGYAKFLENQDLNKKKVLGIKFNKLQKVSFDEYAVGAITSGLKELIEQAKTKINQSSGQDIQTIKKQALANCNSALLLLGEIEVCVHEPVLNREYTKMRQEIDRSLASLKNLLNNDLEKCLTINKTQCFN